jgi:hypothetical protein
MRRTSFSSKVSEWFCDGAARFGARWGTAPCARGGAFLVALGLALGGCSAANTQDGIYFGDGDPAEVVAPAERGAELARFELATGRVVLVAEPGGGVGVAETTSLAMGVAEHLIEASRATPLEVFLALSPADAVPPPALVTAHAAATANAEPRHLEAPIATVIASGFYDCDALNWSTWHAGVTAGYEDRQAVFNTTSGDILFTGVINGQYQRRFDACAGDNILDDMTVYIDRKSSAAALYTNILFDDVHAYQRFYYTSIGGAYPDWRMRIQRPSSGTPKSYGAGGAWSSTGIILGQ